MEQEYTPNEQNQTKKIYINKAIYVATFFGGPLVAGYLISNNFKVFNEPGKATKTWIYAIIATIVIFGGVFLIPNIDEIPSSLIPFIYAAIVYYLVKAFQGRNIDAHIDSGGLTYTWWRAILVSIIGLIITVIPIFLVIFVVNAETSTAGGFQDVKTYGIEKNEIYFSAKNISDDELDKIANGLTKTGFFNEQQKRAIYVKKNGNSYEMAIVLGHIINKEKLFAIFTKFRDQLQVLLPDHKIIIDLVEKGRDQVIKRIGK